MRDLAVAAVFSVGLLLFDRFFPSWSIFLPGMLRQLEIDLDEFNRTFRRMFWWRAPFLALAVGSLVLAGHLDRFDGYTGTAIAVAFIWYLASYFYTMFRTGQIVRRAKGHASKD